MIGTTARAETTPLMVRLRPARAIGETELFELCRLNPELRIERTAEGDLELMPPTGGASGSRNARLTYQLTGWAITDGTGEAFDSSTGFTLPNGATRSPDASWVRNERLARLTPQQREQFMPLCPDFVVELLSPSDSPSAAHAKMQEYLENGARLGWLLGPSARQVAAYRPGATTETLDDPARESGDPILPGFILDVHGVWGPPTES